jgi:TRAP-type uncharacterized transport system fused permease subunit
MIGIGVATSAAGIVVGTVTLTGIGLVMTEFVEFISGGNLMLILLFHRRHQPDSGHGPAHHGQLHRRLHPDGAGDRRLGAQNGLIVPLIAVHLFVFYFGILADDTPPVGLAAFAAAGISGGDPIRTGIQGFTYDIRTAVLPFHVHLQHPAADDRHCRLVAPGDCHLSRCRPCWPLPPAPRASFLTKSRIWETAALLLVAFTLFRPGFWWDMIYPPLIKSRRPPKWRNGRRPWSRTPAAHRGQGRGYERQGVYTKTLMLRWAMKPPGRTAGRHRH